jgi:hypothetical protein
MRGATDPPPPKRWERTASRAIRRSRNLLAPPMSPILRRVKMGVDRRVMNTPNLTSGRGFFFEGIQGLT